MRFALSLFLSLVPGLATAAAPTLAVQGRLATVSGAAVTDGTYALTFAFYEAADSALATTTAVEPTVAVVDGLFDVRLGSATALDPAPFRGGVVHWVGIVVDGEPELLRLPLSPVPYAFRADSAADLQCTGCVSAAELDPNALSLYARIDTLHQVAFSGSYLALADLPELKPVATSGSYFDPPDRPTLATVATSGSYTSLSEQPTLVGLSQSCSAGAAVIGIDAAGALQCSALGVAPIGAIDAWHSALGGTPALPPSWVTCNGQTVFDDASPYNGQAVPNLNGESRFLRGSASSGGVGGAETHAHGVTQTGADHAPDASHFTDGTIIEPANHLPPFFNVVWVIRVK